MKAKAIFLFLALTAIGLSSCGDDTSVDSDESTSSLSGVSEETSSIESESSESPKESSSLDETSSEEPIDTTPTYDVTLQYEEWPAGEIADLLYQYVGSTVEIPAPSEELSAGRTYDVYGNASYGAIQIEAAGDFTGYIEEAAEAGWLKAGIQVYANAEFLNSPDLTLQLLVFHYDEEDGYTTLQIAKSSSYYAGWPTEAVATAMNSVIGNDAVALPPITTGTLYTVTNNGNFFDVASYTTLISDYEPILTEASFAYDEANDIYVDPKSSYGIELTELTQNGDTRLRIRVRKISYWY